MASLEELRNNRLSKLASLKEKGEDPYPASVSRTHENREAAESFESLAAEGKNVTLAGRVMALRPQGGLCFFNISDGTGLFQGLIKNEEGAEGPFELWIGTVDLGDFVEVTGKLFETKRKEKTLQVESWRMLAKTLRPLPEKWHGLQDPEEKMRRRYLDTLMSPEVRERFEKRSRMVSEIRRFLEDAGYLEVETPMLQPQAGGATAAPFKTHHNALDMDVYLRIAPELYLKRLLIGGFPKVYELNRNFRNEGIDVTHHPEFTMLEFYEAYSDAKSQMAFVEKLIKSIVKKVTGGTSFVWDGEEINVGKKFAVIEYFDLLKRFALIDDPENISLEDLKLKAEQLGVATEKSDSRAKMLDGIYKKTARPKIVQPTFIIGYPTEYLPLAKRSAKNPKFVDAFQLVMGGLETVKAFSELNDPIDQKERLLKEEENKAKGDAEAQSSDEDFIEALEYGMPPAGGVGIGIDRLTMLLTGEKNIREVILFPLLRPKN